MSNLNVEEIISSGARPTNSCTDPNAPLSKRARKRLQKRLNYLESRKERKKIRKEKIKSGELRPPKNSRKLVKKTGTQVKDSKCKIGIILDMSWEHLMNQKDLGKSLKQIMRVYCINRRLPNPLKLHVTSFTSIVKKEMDKNEGYLNWDCEFHEAHFMKAFESTKDLIYLSSESETVLETLQDNKFYIIGGLVDHNLHKGVCHEKAIELGIPTARLPISEYIKLKTRKVLTIDQVYNIIALVSEGKSWKDTLLEVLPERKRSCIHGKRRK
ncbi:TRMT10 [Lepeophtheirus salmonis]|uniref:tRNA (guanine(9)-N(1))-methyltransferase n=1 Tax=Lepeophtheirus salmonis TaxID=72036 RepID=A0A7R8H661_LEPSM|nr:TRMT10 [Lepeophtheirus salmonis]CAF2893722.1 TRMT10 [Lepeophtheirus salmonis]